MLIIVEQSVGWELARETEVLGENLSVPLCPPPTPDDLTSNPDRRGGKPATNRLSLRHGLALNFTLYYEYTS
jgi:hypothetical protein